MDSTTARKEREHFLRAFDIYKSNLNYGIECETEEEHHQVLDWYSKILKLPLESAPYLDCPTKIKRYLPKPLE